MTFLSSSQGLPTQILLLKNRTDDVELATTSEATPLFSLASIASFKKERRRKRRKEALFIFSSLPPLPCLGNKIRGGSGMRRGRGRDARRSIC